MDDHSGHRSRHRKKVLEKLPKSLNRPSDTELLEVVLYAVNPRGDTRPLAERLLADLGGLDGVCSRSIPELCREKGVGTDTAFLLSLIGELSRRTEWLYCPGPQITSPEIAFEYMKRRLIGLTTDTTYIVCLDGNSRAALCKAIKAPLTVENMYRFGPDIVKAHSRKLILFHAYPDGDPVRDENEIIAVRHISDTLRIPEILTLDFIMYSKDKFISMAKEGFFTDNDPRREAYCPAPLQSKRKLSWKFPTANAADDEAR